MQETRSEPPGFTLVEIMIVLAIIGFLLTIAIPSFVQARTNTQKNICLNNLRHIQAAKEQYALDYGKDSSYTPNESNIGPYLKGYSGGSLDNRVYCPLESTKSFTSSYTLNNIGTSPDCQKDPTNHKL